MMRLPANSGRRRAFTLVEILITIAIIAAVLALVSAPLSRMLADARFDSAVRQVGSAVDACRNEAQRSGKPVEVRFSLVDARWRCASAQVAVQQGSGRAAPEPKPEVTRLTLPAGLTLRGRGDESDSAQRLGVMLPDGSGVSGPGIVLTDGGTRAVRLTLSRWSGTVVATPVEPPTEASPSQRAAPAANPRRRGRPSSVRRRAGILLEVMVALAIFVAAAIAVLAMVDRSAASLAEARRQRAAVDLARSAMSKLEAGLATPETLNGPVPAWSEENSETIGDAPAAPSGWELRISTEPTSFAGLTLVTVEAVRASQAGDRVLTSFTLRQFVRLAGSGPVAVSAEADSGGTR